MGTRILVADDSPTIRRRAATTLGDAGHLVTCVEDGQAAWSSLEAGERFGVLLCDILMPGIDGYELCRRVKADGRFASIPVLLLRGTFEPWDQARAESVGADGFITKPFDAEAVLSTVEAVLAEMPPPPEAAAGSPFDSAATARFEASPFDLAPLAETPMPDEAVSVEHEPLAPALPHGGSRETAPFGDAPAGQAVARATWSPDVPAERQPAAQPAVAAVAAQDGDPFGSEPFGALEADALPATASARPAWDPGSDGEALAGVGTPGEVTPLMAAHPLVTPAGPVVETSAADGATATWSPKEREPVTMTRPTGEDAVPLGSDEPFGPPRSAGAPADVPAARTPQPTAVAGLVLDEALIDRIAERVVARLTTEQIERIAWDVVPDVAEALIRKRLGDIEARLTEE